MQAIILAAGRGSRLGKLTEELPKAFLEVQGFKLIEYNIALLHSLDIHDITIVTGYHCELFEKLTEQIKGIRCVFNPFYEVTNVLGSFYAGQDTLTEDFVYLHADTLCSPEIFGEMMEAEGDIILPVDFRACDEEAMKVKTEGGRVIEINKTMPCAEAEGEFIGIAKISGTVISDLKKTSKELMKEKAFSSYFEAAIQRLADMGKYEIKTVSTRGMFWGEVDFLQDYQKVIREIPSELVELTKREFKG
ncbi:phosphocholine cytidylyltransferase family protein [Enterocloster bolteae]|uniref:phosphocholine cytidylyltransferase family protein n=1 Tax=Enterocloster bolteae TaxID=208479 RepID=UPI002A7FDA59|nr:phosphocholine cytidylyltransferase family protein [Enterocloster bolteae]